jgi:hypothetical protein
LFVRNSSVTQRATIWNCVKAEIQKQIRTVSSFRHCFGIFNRVHTYFLNIYLNISHVKLGLSCQVYQLDWKVVKGKNDIWFIFLCYQWIAVCISWLALNTYLLNYIKIRSHLSMFYYCSQVQKASFTFSIMGSSVSSQLEVVF